MLDGGTDDQHRRDRFRRTDIWIALGGIGQRLMRFPNTAFNTVGRAWLCGQILGRAMDEKGILAPL